MKITALIENKSTGDLAREHGLAAFIEYNGSQYLLDAGASNLFADNADKLGINLSEVTAAILSHGHYDHSGGYEAFFSRNSKAQVYLRPKAKERCYAKIGFCKRYIGIAEGILEQFPDRFVYVDSLYRLAKGVWLIPHLAKRPEQRTKRSYLYRQTSGRLCPDDFQHEHSLVFEEARGLVVLNSCCHSGVENIIAEVKAAFPGKDILAVIGGFHLKGIAGTNSMNLKANEVKALGHQLKQSGVKYIYTCHCTGDPAYQILKEILGDQLHYFSTGTIVNL